MGNAGIYVTTMYRFGDRESHSYTLCAVKKKEIAIEMGQHESEMCGGKYFCEVDYFYLGTIKTCVYSELED